VRGLVLVLLLAGCTSPAPPVATPSPAPPATTPPTTAPPVTRTPAPRPTSVDYAFPVARCRVTYGRAHHDYPATDIFAATGCPYVSPVAGRVDEVSYADRWDPATNRGDARGGLFVSVVGIDGVRYYGSHLSAVAAGIEPGVRVRPGTRLGSVGTTGSARGTPPHLHFGISRTGSPAGEINPYPYLTGWPKAGPDRGTR
jgi:murein DD-endopeptidase MepM/ murein hydrolase activator NlpD